MNPELDSANLERFIFFNNAPLQVPSCPLAGKALQLSLSLFPYFWAGLFSTLIHQGSLLGSTGLGITQCKVGLWLYPLFRVMSCVCSLAFWNLSFLIQKNRIIPGLLGWLNDIVYLESPFQGLAWGWLSLKMTMITIILQGDDFPSFLVCCH